MTQDESYIDSSRMLFKALLPLNEVVIDFFDELKSLTRGYARSVGLLVLVVSTRGYARSVGLLLVSTRGYARSVGRLVLVVSTKAGIVFSCNYCDAVADVA